ncbi:zinc ribbon domain-containing protein [Sphaerimonospora mesophila]|uniref:zinc ribbon domain-containing protein n=1 Tax=Sphaerimonospora mesophila TaxID=37483 RepID=UPI001F21886C
MWNKQRTTEVLIDPHDVALGVHQVRQSNPDSAWVRSRRPAHPAIVILEDFDRAQFAPVVIGTPRTYVFRGLLRCGFCQRSMEGSWINNQSNYRCRQGHHRNVFIREDKVAEHLGALLIRAVAESRYAEFNVRQSQVFSYWRRLLLSSCSVTCTSCACVTVRTTWRRCSSRSPSTAA